MTSPSSIFHLPSSRRIDALQAAIERLPQAELPLTHRFTPGMYIRTIFMPAGALVISKIHRTQHPFVVTKGRCAVWQSCDRLPTVAFSGQNNCPAPVETNVGEGARVEPLAHARGSVAKVGEGAEIREIRAGHIGITLPGARRILYIYEDTEWTTFHATDKTTPEAVEADIIEPHDFDREEALEEFIRAATVREPVSLPLADLAPVTENPLAHARGSVHSAIH